ncbi:MAG: T9SS type A sorting domain-containing protein, partial [Ignavibacteriaceae bacterium]|nr:T9SS type A sorting domain-containing protein [Ignavibacteriaceae bacterium]
GIIAGSSGKIIDSASSNGTFNPTDFFNTNNNRSFATTAEVMLTTPFDLNNPNPLPQGNSPVLTGGGTPPNDGFFDETATFVGAFGSTDWTFGWARFEPDSASQLTDIKEVVLSGVIPNSFELNQNYPNPFNPTTKIKYSVTTPSSVKLSVYNIIGQQVSVLVDDFKNAGTYELEFDASNLSSGVYIYRLVSNSNIISKKMTLLK